MSVKVFISSRIEEFSQERSSIANLLANEMGLAPIYFEGEPAGGHLPNWWRRRIADSDIYVLLLGKDLSWPVADELLSAKRLARPTVILTSEPRLLSERRLRIIDSERWVRRDGDVQELYSYLLDQKWKEFLAPEDLEAEVRAGVAQYLRVQAGVPLDMVVNRERIEKMSAVLVKPREYVSTQELTERTNLAIICGPPHIGKTAMALHLLGQAVESNRVVTVVEPHNVSELAPLRYVKNIGIFLDDVFGAMQAEVESFADRWEELEAIARDNLVLATSRSEVLEAVSYTTRLEARVLQEQVITLDESSYSARDRENMVRSHLLYWESEGRIFPGRDTILSQASSISRHLHFPHNIAYLIEFFGPLVKSQRNLSECIEKSKVIEEEIAKWLLRLDREVRLFVIVVALYDGASEESLCRAYDELCRQTGTTRIPQGEIREVVRPYIGLERNWRFRHPSYRLAVMDRAYAMYGNDLIGFMRSLHCSLGLNPELSSKTKKALAVFGVRHPDQALAELRRLASGDRDMDRDSTHAIRAIGQTHPHMTLDDLLGWPSSQSVFRLIGGLVSRLSHRPKEEVDGWVPLLAKAIAHPDPAIKWRMAPLLQRLASRRPTEALPLVAQLLTDDSPKVRKAAVDALRTIGAKAPYKALKSLKKMESDPDESVRRHATTWIVDIKSCLRKAGTTASAKDA